MKKMIPTVPSFKKIKESASRTSLTIVLAVFVFFILISAIGMAALLLYILAKTNVIENVGDELQFSTIILFMFLISLAIGGTLAFFSSRLPLKPLNSLINKMNRLAAGDFDARLELKGPLASHPAFQEIADSFNTMAEELGNTEMLRSDFINHFSHEFKTPIVSITGFAKLLNKGNLTEEQKQLYLQCIEEESLRLSYMATNVLNLTKVENQKILTDITSFNLSEQIRSVILLFEQKWLAKNTELQLDFDEFMLEANEELLKQVWINLIDNAVKFVPRCGTIAVEIHDVEDYICVQISNTGNEIPAEKHDKIFQKFYQADESHAEAGNGIGLAVVKRIVDIHHGSVSVASEQGMTTFSVALPKNQKNIAE